MTCDVCQGSQYICFPVSTPAAFTFAEATAPSFSETVIDQKTFPCPQCCGKQAADERIEIAGVALTIPDDLKGKAADFFRKEAASTLAHNFMKHASIDFRTSPHPLYPHQSELIGVVGLVTKQQVNRIEKRAKAEAAKIVEEVIEVAARDIAMWGSAYTGLEGTIKKGMAIDSIRQAFRKVTENVG